MICWCTSELVGMCHRDLLKAASEGDNSVLSGAERGVMRFRCSRWTEKFVLEVWKSLEMWRFENRTNYLPNQHLKPAVCNLIQTWLSNEFTLFVRSFQYIDYQITLTSNYFNRMICLQRRRKQRAKQTRLQLNIQQNAKPFHLVSSVGRTTDYIIQFPLTTFKLRWQSHQIHTLYFTVLDG